VADFQGLPENFDPEDFQVEDLAVDEGLKETDHRNGGLTLDTVWWRYRLGRWRAPETGRSTE
jgi:hypothetical protein